VFDKWVDMVGREVIGLSEVNYALVFFADIMHDGNRKVMTDLSASLAYEDGKPLFMLHDKPMRLSSSEGYRRFWAMYHRPPEAEHREYLLARRDSLLPLDERNFKGAYYTPLKVVDKAYDLLAQTLGKNWQQKYIVWDMCCGVGNLEVKHSNHNNLFMSTLDQADIDVMKAAKTCVQATKFQYDYLNDDIDDFGNIDYQISHKLPVSLRQAIADANKGVKGAKQILVLINPPYAEATNADNTAVGNFEAENKTGVAKTKFAATAMSKYGKASNELFTQFMARIAQEIPTATLAMFSTLKYVNAPNFEKFRTAWNAKYLDGFVVHSKAFDGLTGNFPIGFLVWHTHNSVQNPPPLEGSGVVKKSKVLSFTEITAAALDKNANLIGKKTFYNLPNDTFLNVWIKRPKTNKQEVIPLKNAITPTTGKAWVKTWADNGIAYMCSGTNDLQNAAKFTFILSSPASRGHGFYITPENLWQAAIIFTVQRVIKPTWLNDRDQFLQPTEPLTEVFKNDCLVWMLFNGSNLTASANNLEWNEKKWSIVNHFIPFTAAEVGANDKFESNFMVDYLNAIKKTQLSKEAKTVLAQGKTLWQQYHATEFERKIKDEFKLNRADVGWYQIRKALEAHAKNEVVDFDPFKTAYTELSEKLRPMVYELGFLK
jgi:hypothetical protein